MIARNIIVLYPGFLSLPAAEPRCAYVEGPFLTTVSSRLRHAKCWFRYALALCQLYAATDDGQLSSQLLFPCMCSMHARLVPHGLDLVRKQRAVSSSSMHDPHRTGCLSTRYHTIISDLSMRWTTHVAPGLTA